MSSARIIILGAGNWATTAHIPGLAQHSDAELVGVLAHDPDIAAKVAADFNVPHYSCDAEELIRQSRADAAIVSSVASMHHPHAMAALSAGLHTLVEKPMTVTLEQAEQLQAAADQNDLHLMLGCPWHWSPHAIEAARLVQSGRLGPIRMISQLFTNYGIGIYKGLPFDEAVPGHLVREHADEIYLPPRRTSYSDPKISGGGQTHNQLTHAVALLAMITGRAFTSVFARFENWDLPIDVSDVLNMKMDDDSVVNVSCSLLPGFAGRQHELRIVGSEGVLALELWNGVMAHYHGQNEVTTFPPLSAEAAYPIFAPCHNLVDIVLGRADNGSPGSLGVAAMGVIDAAIESNRTGSDVAVVAGPRQS